MNSYNELQKYSIDRCVRYIEYTYTYEHGMLHSIYPVCQKYNPKLINLPNVWKQQARPPFCIPILYYVSIHVQIGRYIVWYINTSILCRYIYVDIKFICRSAFSAFSTPNSLIWIRKQLILKAFFYY